VWDVETGEEVLMLSGHAGRVTALGFSPDGRRIITSSLDGSVKVWHARTGEELLTLHCDELWSLAISPDGRMIAGATGGAQVKLWKTTSPR
jgi:WD40 repeat protein